MESIKEVLDQHTPPQPIRTISAVLKDGILEMLYDQEAHQTRFAFWNDGAWTYEDSHPLNHVQRMVPFSPNNSLVRNRIVLLPSAPEEYGTDAALFAQIKGYIHRYVDLSPLFEDIASYYVLFSWVYDGFNEVPYLRVRGDYGSGKTRFLLIVGNLCYKSIFASGASTVSPVFRLLETCRGTLIMDESDFRFSDEKAEMVKILNNGNVQGFPVLRSDTNGKGEFNPNAYNVFGPKIVATRGEYEDKALESRFLTEEMGTRPLRPDIAINMSQDYKAEALAIRNQLLLFRFRNLNKRPALAELVDRTLEPRLNQIFVPLLSIIDDPAARESLRAVARQCQREMVAERGMGTEAQVLEVIQDLLALDDEAELSLKAITDRFTELYGEDYERKITGKWVGGILRKRLHLNPYRTHGKFILPVAQRPMLDRLFEKYGLKEVITALN